MQLTLTNRGDYEVRAAIALAGPNHAGGRRRSVLATRFIRFVHVHPLY
jgi:hypothetical protein